MASTRDIKRKIKSVNSTQQITRAMNLVAASKLQRARLKLEETRPYIELTENAIASVVNNTKGIRHPFLEEREVKKTLIIAIASDRGLCGGFNSNISKDTEALINSKGNVVCITVGNKIKDYLERRNKEIIEHYGGISEKPDYATAAKLGKKAVSMFLSKEVDEVYVAYTAFKSTISYQPTISRVIPVDTTKLKETETNAQMLFEPSEEEVLTEIIPKYVAVSIYGALMESGTSQQGARMTAMDSATENAGEMIEKYTLLFNRARQDAITQEITEIVGGANALM